MKKIKGLISDIDILTKVGKNGKEYRIYKVQIANDPQLRTFSAMFHLPRNIEKGRVCEFQYEMRESQGRNGRIFKNYDIIDPVRTGQAETIPTIQVDDSVSSPATTSTLSTNVTVKLLTEIRNLLKELLTKNSTSVKPIETEPPIEIPEGEDTPTIEGESEDEEDEIIF